MNQQSHVGGWPYGIVYMNSNDIFKQDAWASAPSYDDEQWDMIADADQSFTIQVAHKPLRLRFGGEGGVIWRVWPGQHFTRLASHPLFKGVAEVKAANYGGSRYICIVHDAQAEQALQSSSASGDDTHHQTIDVINFAILYTQQLNLSYALNNTQQRINT